MHSNWENPDLWFIGKGGMLQKHKEDKLTLEDTHVMSVLAQVKMENRMEVFNDAVLPYKKKFSKDGWQRILKLLPKKTTK